MIALEEQEQSKLREQAEAVASEKRAKQAAARKATKQKVTAYKAAKMAAKAREMEKEANRLAVLRDIHEKQARIDTDRLVQAEKQRLAELHRQRVLAKERVELEASRRQSRLDCIAKKVRPVVKSDPERITSETRAWRIKLEQRRQEAELLAELEEFVPSHLMTSLTTFSDSQLYADRRTRLTAALHSAGLLDSDYARTLLSGVQPTVPPRKDSQTCEQLKQILNPESKGS
ncbi:coiled-coil domain-containing protein 148 [Clonorchis sinensis]|uniref:Coiled-coil domain-containing protein 148 n=1 Tax=Clonorchis sinensis TaxID=79923 RepID=G7YML7_CLOSI|nr:coiled-coil domain-containing protein 148 [Clonorchis sinensis]